MDLAKEIGTYEISIEPSICCRSVPPNPATKARLEAVRVEENKLDIKKLESESIKTAKIINL
jgi:adenylyl- and sulfurtransferase ThiI